MFALFLATAQSDADLARVLLPIAAILAVLACIFCVLHRGVESALGWASIALGLFCGWLLL